MHRLRWQGVSMTLSHVDSALNPADPISWWGEYTTARDYYYHYCSCERTLV